MVVVIALALLGFVLVSIRNNRKLQSKNVIISDALQEKEVLMREIHHRVKNNIQAIKSIVHIQKRKATTPETVESLNNTLNKINAMAVIHKRLYRQERLSGLGSDVYLGELLDDLLRSFEFGDDNLTLDVQLCDHSFEADRLLTLGLIFNELVTNACKYGASDDGVLRLQITTALQTGAFVLTVYSAGKHQGDAAGFGSELVQALVKRLGGSIELSAESGCRTSVSIKP